ncbi:MAG TPA: arylsulfotransferase family protein [Solirubrobacteraceae bacterium]|nr:arylsulfotransferase family protein [Solirubrobacteraceae bacterium]
MPRSTWPLLLAVLLAGCSVGGESRKKPAAAAEGPAATPLVSRPDLRPPAVSVDRAPERAGRRLIFVSPRIEKPDRDKRTNQQGALALDERGRTVLFRPAGGEPVTDVRVQRYRGRPVLTWWQGAASKLGIGRGQGIIVDSSYQTIATVQAGNGETHDLHEFLLTPRGTALLTIYSRVRRDLRPLGGRADAQVTQGIVQEVDVESGRVLFEWESIDEIAPSESHHPLPKGKDDSYDYFHINSVEEDADGDLVISARHTSAIYKVDRQTGRLEWRLGGKRSDFEMGPGTDFGLQHDARWVGPDRLQLFDNTSEEKPGPSSVKVLRLDTERMRATLERRLEQPDGMRAESQGNAQALPDGSVMVGWGSAGAFSLFDARDELVFDAHLPAHFDSYRAYIAPWVGRPATRPAIRVRDEEGQVTAWVSWNGATEVRGWQLLAGPSREGLRPVGGVTEWQGLESTLVRMTEEKYVAVAALDADGREIGRSEAVPR